MNSLKLIENIYAYLGFRSVERSEDTDARIESCLEELKAVAHFRYTYKYYDSPPEFLKKEPYLSYLSGSRGVFLAVMTLGGEADAKIRLYSRTDAAKAIIFDACASAYLEYLSDSFERTLGENLSFRFCPGYGGSSVSDLKYIFGLVKPEKIGVTLTPAYYMLPSKSMAGIIAVGGAARKTCKGCISEGRCGYRERGEVCYGSENQP